MTRECDVDVFKIKLNNCGANWHSMYCMSGCLAPFLYSSIIQSVAVGQKPLNLHNTTILCVFNNAVLDHTTVSHKSLKQQICKHFYVTFRKKSSSINVALRASIWVNLCALSALCHDIDCAEIIWSARWVVRSKLGWMEPGAMEWMDRREKRTRLFIRHLFKHQKTKGQEGGKVCVYSTVCVSARVCVRPWVFMCMWICIGCLFFDHKLLSIATNVCTCLLPWLPVCEFVRVPVRNRWNVLFL